MYDSIVRLLFSNSNQNKEIIYTHILSGFREILLRILKAYCFIHRSEIQIKVEYIFYKGLKKKKLKTFW